MALNSGEGFIIDCPGLYLDIPVWVQMVSLQGEKKITIPLGSRMARRLEGCWQVVVDIKDTSTFTSELAERTPPKTNMSREKGSFQQGR